MLSHEHGTSTPDDATSVVDSALTRQRAIAGRIGAYTMWAHTPDRAARTAPARRAAMARFEREVDPEGVLSPEERAKRAQYARKAYFQRLGLKSAAARRKKSAAA